MTQKQQFTGKNLEEALGEAAKHYKVDKAFICYNDISNAHKKSFLSKIFSSKVEIEAWVETAKEDLQEAARKAVRDAISPKSSQSAPKSITHQNYEPRSPSLSYDDPKVKALTEEFNHLFFSAFSLSPENYSTEYADGNITVHVEDEFLENSLTKSDKLSLAFEHVFKRVAQKKFGDIHCRLMIDAGSCAEKREERLIGIAKSLAEKVKKSGKNVVLSSKSSQERRIIHLSLDGYPGIGTRSIGMGEKRKLVIFPLEKNPAQNKKPKNNSPQKRKSPQLNPEKRDHD